MEPLAISSHVLQASGLRLDQVVLTLANLHRIYSQPRVEAAVRRAVVDSLEKRWKAADQEVFILAVLFNPFYRTTAFSDRQLGRADLAHMCRRAYERFLRKPVSMLFWSAFHDYLDGKGRFSAANFALDMHQIFAESTVR